MSSRRERHVLNKLHDEMGSWGKVARVLKVKKGTVYKYAKGRSNSLKIRNALLLYLSSESAFLSAIQSIAVPFLRERARIEEND